MNSTRSVERLLHELATLWWVINLYELQDDLIARVRAYFTPEFDAPDWRAPYREAG